jgi:nitrate reductase delta subunit
MLLLADALAYPREDYVATIESCRLALASRAPEIAADVASFETTIESIPIGRLQELYTAAFDLDLRTSLDIGWHIFGESHDRGAFMAHLRAEERAVGLPASTELPDHLTRLLRLMARSDSGRAHELAAQVSPVLDRITAVLEEHNNPYACLLRAIGASVGQLGD